MTLFTGSGVAIVTPFTDSMEVNYPKLKELLEFHIENNTDAIIINGTTGESATMTDQESLDVIKFTVDVINNRIPVIAGTGSNDTKHALECSIATTKLGVDGLLIVTPYYNKGNENGIYNHYKSIAEAVDCPIILYNVPSRTGVNLSIPLLEKLAKIDNIIAIKEASGNISYAAEIARVIPSLTIYSGNDDMVIPLLSLGAKGVISVSANIIPKITHEMVISFLNSDLNKGMGLQLDYNGLVNTLFIETNPIPIKDAMNFLGYDVGPCRLPLGEMFEDNKIILHNILNEYGVEKWI